MPNEPQPAERVHGSVSTDGLRLGGWLWIIAGVICSGLLIFVFMGENRLAQNPGLSAMVLGGAVAALLTEACCLPDRASASCAGLRSSAWRGCSPSDP
jgi:hypothetical protein